MSSPARLVSAVMFVAVASFLGSNCARAQSSPQKTAPTGTIAGRVTVGGKAAPNISVAAYSIETMNTRKEPVRSITDSEGRYRLAGLPPAQYQIVSLAPDLTSADEEQEGNFGFIYVRSSKSVTLAAGEDVENIDLKLVRGGVITGRVTDASNKPVVEELITLLPVDASGNQVRNPRVPFRSESYQTDDRGIYRIYGLPAGRYKVSTGMESGGAVNFSRGFYARTFYPDTPDETKARVVELAEGAEATGIDIQVGIREKAYIASGRVVDAETGQPLAGLRLSYLIAGKGPENYSQFYVDQPTGARGSFQINGLAPGRYGAYVTSEYEVGDYYSEVTHFDVVDKDVSGVEIKAIRGLTLSGVVVVEGEAQGNAPARLGQLRISTSAMQTGQAQQRNGGAAAVAPDGSFRIGGLRPGRFSFFLYPMRVSSSSRPSISRIERDGIAVTQGVELTAGQSISDLRIIVNFGRGTIRGGVTFVGGILPPDARAVIRCTREGRPERGGAYLDSRGRYVINDLPPGTYEVTLQIINNFHAQPPGPPQKQFVQVSNESESEVNFVVDLTPKERP